MYERLIALTVCMAFGTTLSAGDQPKAAGKNELDSKLAVLDRFAGEWVVDGKWAGGDALHARSVYQWGLGKKIMHAKTFVKDGDNEYQRYEAILAWNPKEKCLFQISFAFDGTLSEYLVEAKDKDKLHIGFGPYAGGKAPMVRQTLLWLDNDSFQWVVLLQDGDQWKQLIDATWKRKAK